MATHGRYWKSWVNRSGPGDSRPTALQIIKDENLNGKLKGKVFVVTGASAGIGVETVRAIHASGAIVFATGRNPSKLTDALKDIEISDPENKAPIHPIVFDQESLDSVRKGAQEIIEKSGGKINVLINNAGVCATPEGKTADGYETQFGVNHLAHFLLFQILKPALLSASTPDFQSRVVVVSSKGHRFGQVQFDDYGFEKTAYDPLVAYGQSKTANIWMANEIERRYGSKGLHSLSLHPGTIWTGLSVHWDPELLKAMQSDPEFQKYVKNAEQGAATSVYTAVSKDLEGKGAVYLSNCDIWGPRGDGDEISEEGYAPWAYDANGEKQLWKDSLKFVGLKDDE